MPAEDLILKLSDPKYFIETFFWIINKDRKKVPFLFNPPQARYFDSRTHNDLILKARKEGFSSIIRALWLHACMFQENTRAVILAHEMDATMRHFENVRWTLENMGYDGLKIVVEMDKDNQKQLSFPELNSSFWIGTAGARSFGRGDDITHLHLSEVAHYQNQSILTSVMEACVPTAFKVMETTANGVGEAFHKLWTEAMDPTLQSPWKAHFFAWHEDPTNQMEKPSHINVRLTEPEKRLQARYKLAVEQVLWYRNKRAEMPEKEKMPQEYPSNAQEAFLSSGQHAFNLERLASMKDAATPAVEQGYLSDDARKIELIADSEGELRIWKRPRKHGLYLIAADASEGVQDGDFCVGTVFDRSSWEVVAVFRGRLDPGVFGDAMLTLGHFYNEALLVPELNNHGWATVEVIKRAGYPHLLNTKELWPNETPKDGFPTNEKTRSQIITAGRNAVDRGTSFIPDRTTIEEMEIFVKGPTGKFEAQEGGHDDCVITFCIGVYCLGFLGVDETYAERALPDNKRPMVIQPLTSTPTAGRRSATGYR